MKYFSTAYFASYAYMLKMAYEEVIKIKFDGADNVRGVFLEKSIQPMEFLDMFDFAAFVVCPKIILRSLHIASVHSAEL
ncbi:hypothetical protein N836_19945 [Leptolyngbya sp. Heron Island J]|uniref:hypothetical protein n=1 Tax=Leptolyngbya sp. Heron Island J TaxID=1385935 RepID=UPI0003B9A267|nr:hypothetical protein [Leptolyngbya sp. Heron Island J]ESA33805.1 hypothetical protein N836_19945 [Leptolyngbya sp. Heron Island J]